MPATNSSSARQATRRSPKPCIASGSAAGKPTASSSSRCSRCCNHGSIGSATKLEADPPFRGFGPRRRLDSSLAGHDIDAERDHPNIEKEGNDTLHKGDAPDAAGIDLHIGYLERHADHEREIDEIPVVRIVVSGKFQAGTLGAIITVEL